jgi:hypothetical protein
MASTNTTNSFAVPSNWADQLARMAQQPLEACPNFPRIAQRHEAWWHQQVLDRPIFLGSVNSNPYRQVDRGLALLDDPTTWLDTKLTDMRLEHRVGDSLPIVRVDFGAAALGALMGARAEIGSNTVWTHASINDDWSNCPNWQLHAENLWWQRLQSLTTTAAACAAGRFLVCAPDIGGASDTLLNMRGPESICIDTLEQPQHITEAMEAIFPTWWKVFTYLYEQTLAANSGLVQWLGLWSNQPYLIPTCDLNFLLGPEQFEQLCLPDIAKLARAAGRTVFHLDGPQAARHIDALLGLDELTAIQFTPGEGTPSALAWVDMFRKIQARGHSVLIVCPPEEVLELCEKLPAEGLAILTFAKDVQQLDAVFEQFCGYYGVKW